MFLVFTRTKINENYQHIRGTARERREFVFWAPGVKKKKKKPLTRHRGDKDIEAKTEIPECRREFYSFAWCHRKMRNRSFALRYDKFYNGACDDIIIFFEKNKKINMYEYGKRTNLDQGGWSSKHSWSTVPPKNILLYFYPSSVYFIVNEYLKYYQTHMCFAPGRVKKRRVNRLAKPRSVSMATICAPVRSYPYAFPTSHLQLRWFTRPRCG